MNFQSPAFGNQKTIPIRYTGEGADVSPPLEWSGAPSQTREFAIIMEDPDAPSRPGMDYPFVHWIAYNISSNMSSLPEGISTLESRLNLPVSLDQGLNSFGKIGYGGPMPPVGSGAHHYRFTLYALNQELGVPPGVSKHRLLKSMQGHVIETAYFIGTCIRKPGQKAPELNLAQL